MRIVSVRWARFRIPFRTAFATSRGTFAYREGLTVWLETDAGIVGLGEALPYPGQEATAFAAAAPILSELTLALVGRDIEEAAPAVDGVAGSGRWAFLRAGLDIAVCDALAKAAGSGVGALLAEGRSPAPTVRVNATIGEPDPAAAGEAARAARAAGFPCVKLKVASDGEHERARVAEVRAALGPDVALRLDANGAWTAEQAIGIISDLERYGLELVEQPIPPGDPRSMRRVREAVATPIAADEDVTDLDAARRLLGAGAADVLVVKPMVVGGLRPANHIVELAAASGASVIVTTTIDAGIATAAALHLAATLPPGSPACGLATGPLLVADLLLQPLVLREGHMWLPTGPGLGIELDDRQMRQYGAALDEVAQR